MDQAHKTTRPQIFAGLVPLLADNWWQTTGNSGGATPLGTIGGGTGLPFTDSAGNAIGNITRGISAIIGFLTICAAIWFMFQLVIGGIQWLTAGGDKNNLAAARDRLTNAFVGLIIVVAGVSIVAILGQFFGFDILNPAKYLQGITL